MYYTVTLNPSLDYHMSVPCFAHGETNRSVAESVTYGGKGINVAVMLTRLGESATALGFAGGFTGEMLSRLLQGCGVRAALVPIASPTRINVKLAEEGGITEINAKGPLISDAEKAAFWEMLDAVCPTDTVVLAGSVPPSFSEDVYARIMKRLSPKGVRIAVDTAGGALLSVLPYHPFLIKPNRAELAQAVGKEIGDINGVIAAARDLQGLGAQNVLVSLGSDGALLLDGEGKIYRQKAPVGKAVSTVGAGDTMLAAFLHALKGGMAEALAFAVRAGSATAFSAALAEVAAIEKIKMPPQE